MNRSPEQAGHPLEATMRRARDIIPGADGRVTESIKWKTPTFAYRGNIASFNIRAWCAWKAASPTRR